MRGDVVGAEAFAALPAVAEIHFGVGFFGAPAVGAEVERILSFSDLRRGG